MKDTPNIPFTADQITQLTERAHVEINALCHGKKWTMCIPAQPDADSDLVISVAIRAQTLRIAFLESELTILRQRLLEAEGQNKKIIEKCLLRTTFEEGRGLVNILVDAESYRNIESKFNEQQEQIKLLQKAIVLLSAMVEGGEKHSDASRELVRKSLEIKS